MFAVNQGKADKPASQILKDLHSTLREQFVVIDLGVRKLVRWLREEVGRHAMLHELNLLNDRCLNDIGRRRPLDQKADDLVRRLRAGG